MSLNLSNYLTLHLTLYHDSKKISKKLKEQGIIKQLAKPQIIKKKMNSNEQILQDEFAKNQNKQTEGIELNSEKYIALEKQQIKSIPISKLFKE